MKDIKPRKGVSSTVKVLRLLGGWIEVSNYPPRSQKEIHTGVPVNSLANYSLVTNAELKMAQALMYWRMMDLPK